MSKHKLASDEIENILKTIIKALQKMGALPKVMSAATIDNIVQNVSRSMAENGVSLKYSNLKDPNILKQLSVAVVTASFAPTEAHRYENSGLKLTLDLVLKKDLTPAENRQLTTALAFISVMQNKPGLKLNLDLIFKENLTPAEKQEFEDSLAIALIQLNENQLDPALKLTKKDMDDLITLVKDEFKQPGAAKENINDLHKDPLYNLLFGSAVAPLLPCIFPDIFPEPSLPIHQFSGTLLKPQQAATGMLGLFESRDLSLGEITSVESMDQNFVEAMEEAFEEENIPTYDSPYPSDGR